MRGIKQVVSRLPSIKKSNRTVDLQELLLFLLSHFHKEGISHDVNLNSKHDNQLPIVFATSMIALKSEIRG